MVYYIITYMSIVYGILCICVMCTISYSIFFIYEYDVQYISQTYLIFVFIWMSVLLPFCIYFISNAYLHLMYAYPTEIGH